MNLLRGTFDTGAMLFLPDKHFSTPSVYLHFFHLINLAYLTCSTENNVLFSLFLFDFTVSIFEELWYLGYLGM